MNNPFGIPDELMNAIILATIKGQQEMTKNHKPENPFKVKDGQPIKLKNPDNMAKEHASFTKQLYDAYVEIGFTQGQAFELIKAVLGARRN